MQSYTTKFTNNNIEVIGNKIKIPKLGLVKFAKSREVKGRIINATIRKSSTGKYFVSLLVEEELNPLSKTGSACGIDVGIKDFAVLSNGKNYENPKFFNKFQEKLAKEQRKLFRKEKFSKNWYKQKVKVAKIHERITNTRDDYLHKLSTEIVKSHDIIGMEDLQVVNMLKNKRLSKSISDASWSKFKTMLTYKASWYEKNLVIISKKFPSSQLCSNCGYKNKKVKVLSVRKWTCPKCSTIHSRDLNASKNIKHEAIKITTAGTAGIAQFKTVHKSGVPGNLGSLELSSSKLDAAAKV